MTATVTLSDNAQMVLEKRFAITTSADIPADGPAELQGELRCTSPDEPEEDHRLPFSGTTGELRLYGLLADLDYACTLTVGGEEAWSGGFRTGPLPDGFPSLVVSGDPERASSDEGYVLFNHWKLGTEFPEVQRLIVADGDGRVRWYLALLDADTGGIAGSWLPGVGLVTGGGRGSAPAIRDLSGDVSFDMPPPNEPDPGYHHEALVTSEGWLVSLQGATNTADGVSFIGFRIEARDPATGALTWEFDSQPQVDAGLLPPGTPGDLDPYHANAISWVDDDPAGPAVWLSLRGTGVLLRIDRATRQITSAFGPDTGLALVDGDGQPLPPEKWFWGQHAPEIRGSEFLVYDNGGRRPGAGRYSRVAKYRQLSPTTVELLWDWTESGWYETNFGSVVTMPDTHVLIGTGHCGNCAPAGDTAWMLELDPASGEVVWRFDLGTASDSLYRAQPIGGCEIFANARWCRSN